MTTDPPARHLTSPKTSASGSGMIARGLGKAEAIRWPLARASALFELKYGKALVESSRRPGSVPVYGTNGVTGSHDAALFKGPGVVLGRKGVGNLGVEWVEGDFWVIDTAYALTTVDSVDLKFGYYLIKHVGLNHLKHGTSNPSLTRDAFGAQLFPVPPLAEQRRIAGVLGAFDDLIDTNRRIAEDCTALWRGIVRDALANASETAPLSDLADFVNGKNFTKDASGHGRPVIRTPEVRRGPEAGTVRSDVDAAHENIAREGDTLFVWSGSLMVGRWMWEESLINQHVFKVISKPGFPMWLVFALVEYQMPWFVSLAADKATTMGHIKREHLDAAVPVPSRAEIARLSPVIGPLWNEALRCGVAAQALTRVRDELLPLLLSGRVRVGEVVA